MTKIASIAARVAATALLALLASAPQAAAQTQTQGQDPLAAARVYAAQSEETKADFLAGARIADELEKAPGIEARMWRLRTIARALQSVDDENREQKPIKDWLARHENEVIFSEPSGQYYVSRQLIWELHDRAKTAPGGAGLAEEIAWHAARTPAGGECEGYLNCQLGDSLDSVGRYLELYPKGKYAAAALEELYWLQEEPSGVEPLDRQDVPEAKQQLARWRKILAAVPGAKNYLEGVDMIARAYKVE